MALNWWLYAPSLCSLRNPPETVWGRTRADKKNLASSSRLACLRFLPLSSHSEPNHKTKVTGYRGSFSLSLSRRGRLKGWTLVDFQRSWRIVTVFTLSEEASLKRTSHSIYPLGLMAILHAALSILPHIMEFAVRQRQPASSSSRASTREHTPTRMDTSMHTTQRHVAREHNGRARIAIVKRT